ncbi:M23 family metallopeptidase [Bacillus sp. FJAT-27245]|uniref:M23 family metallopeptidase n=1 Tax=Bacillus sp. FJAT-27245 TaxID=1684144 RepID=UPI0009E9E862|nr:M23 family metallopeptidase [Bacillus sp. FJAT-27245]
MRQNTEKAGLKGGYPDLKILLSLLALLVLLSIPGLEGAYAEELDLDKARLQLYRKTEAATGIPWYYIAAVDRYERNVRLSRKDLPDPEGAISIYFSPETWAGAANPNPEDKNPVSIAFFDGAGIDGNGNRKASRFEDEDVLHAFANHVLKYGSDNENFRIALWEYYHRDKAVGIIMGFAKVFSQFGRIDLEGNAFPVPYRSNHSYKNTWGDARGWGGRRMHEGTDIFAGYGVPVRATSYGTVEMKGWNRFGGWRIGIRDLNNNYHYYAHMSGFAKDINVGDVVEPGKLIGGVGSSGYGPPGTSGKFPPHLHYGMYKDNGFTEWAFDPYPHLRKWERMDKKAKRR